MSYGYLVDAKNDGVPAWGRKSRGEKFQSLGGTFNKKPINLENLKGYTFIPCNSKKMARDVYENRGRLPI